MLLYKKRTLIVILVLLLFVLSGCAAGQNEVPDGKTDTAPDASGDGNMLPEENTMKIRISVNGYELTATLADNSSAKALYGLLEKGDVTVDAHDYGSFEKVGALPESLPRNDEDINTIAGDIILYQGSSICFYYSTNSWDFTRLGRIDGAENLNLKEIYGDGDATFVLSINQ